MKLLAMIIINLIFYSMAFANELKVEINPKKPVAGEVFQAYFRVFTDSNDDPIINFSPSGVEVIGKANQGVSTRTIYANGKLTVTREVTIVYDLVSSKPGTIFIRDINVQLGQQTIRHPMVSVTVLKEAEVLPEVFVMADVPKKTLFLGEGITVRYYLYSRPPVNNLDVKKYPKLNNFLKRFLQEPERTERVSVDGQIYLRNLIYAAKLFPEKVGELKIDSLQLGVTYPASRPGDPFSAFGMGRDFRTKTISSEVVKVIVKPLPAPAPKDFTGLVGKHDFQLQFGQSRLIVNEPLEFQLTVMGGGALENLEAPVIIKNSALEEFETNGDLKIADANQATKTFSYTFLAREDVNIPAKKMSLSYLDPDSEKYVSVDLQLPEIVIAGGSARANARKNNEDKVVEQKMPDVPVTKTRTLDLEGPLVAGKQTVRTWLPYFNTSLAVISVLIALGWIVRKDLIIRTRPTSAIPVSFKRGNFSLSEFTRWLSPVIQSTGKSPISVIRDAELDEQTKSYFIDLLNSNDYKNYSARKSEAKFVYNAGYFKKLGRYIESAKNEGIT